MLSLRLSDIMKMLTSLQFISERYAALNIEYDRVAWSAQDIAEMYDETYVETFLGDPTVAELIQAMPQQPDCEFAGYFNAGFLRYIKCDAANASAPNVPFTFHTHPLGSLGSDMPSETDIHSFLYNQEALSFTLGTHKCWFFIKTAETMQSVERYLKWRDEHLISAVIHIGQNNNEITDLKRFMLKEVFDFELPDTLEEIQNLDWVGLVEDKLSIRVLVADRL